MVPSHHQDSSCHGRLPIQAPACEVLQIWYVAASEISGFCSLLSSMGIGLDGLLLFLFTIWHTTTTLCRLCVFQRSHSSDDIQECTWEWVAPQRDLACLSAMLIKTAGKESLTPLHRLPSIICMQWPSNPPVLFPADPCFNFHLSYFHIILIFMQSLTIIFLVFCPGHCNLFKQKDSTDVFSTSTSISQNPFSLLLKTLQQQKNKEKWCVASSAARLNQHSYYKLNDKTSPWQ